MPPNPGAQAELTAISQVILTSEFTMDGRPAQLLSVELYQQQLFSTPGNVETFRIAAAVHRAIR